MRKPWYREASPVISQPSPSPMPRSLFVRLLYAVTLLLSAGCDGHFTSTGYQAQTAPVKLPEGIDEAASLTLQQHTHSPLSPQDHLVSPGIYLRALTTVDAAELAALVNKPENKAYLKPYLKEVLAMYPNVNTTKERLQQHEIALQQQFQKAASQPQAHPLMPNSELYLRFGISINFGIFLHKEGKTRLIGTITAHTPDAFAPNSVELSFWRADEPELAKKGIVTTACRQFMLMLFSSPVLEIEHINIATELGNEASQAVAQRLGFRKLAPVAAEALGKPQKYPHAPHTYGYEEWSYGAPQAKSVAYTLNRKGFLQSCLPNLLLDAHSRSNSQSNVAKRPT